MWPFLFIIALVPLFFYWSDSITELFPQLAHYFPDKEGKKKIRIGADGKPIEVVEGPVPGKWFTQEDESGYVAWMLADDGQYRLIVGCPPKAPAVVQLATYTGVPVNPHITLNYKYGALPLADGFYTASDVVGHVAQFQEIYVQANDQVIAQFKVPAHESNSIARSLQNQCL